MAIFDYDKKGINAYNGVYSNKNDQKKISKIYGGKEIPDIIPPQVHADGNKICAVLIPLNYKDYKDESEHGYHVIEFLFKKSELLKYKEEAIINNSDNKSVGDSYFFKPGPDSEINTIKLNVDKIDFANYVESNKNTICFDNFKPLLEEIRKFVEDE